MFISGDIVSKRFLELKAVVGLLKGVEEKDNLFADFPICATMQDGGKRKRSNDLVLDAGCHGKLEVVKHSLYLVI